MATEKTCEPTFRIDPALKDASREVDGKEHCSMISTIAMMIRDYCARNNIVIPEQSALVDKGRKQHSRIAKE